MSTADTVIWLRNLAAPVGTRFAVGSGSDLVRAILDGKVAIVLGDQPLLDVAHLTALRDAWLAGAPLAASRFGGVSGAPAVFAAPAGPRSRSSPATKVTGALRATSS